VLIKEHVKEIEELASLFFSSEEIREITGLNPEDPQFKKAYRRGSLKSEAEIRKSIIQLAKDGSSPAQTLAWKMVESTKREEF
jgi:hypothetical protein